jgi:hypothetical protein
MTSATPVDSNPLLVLLLAVQRYNVIWGDQTSSYAEQDEAAVMVLQASRHISLGELDSYPLIAARS